MTQKRPYHHLFGLSWIDFFQGTCIDVEEEMANQLEEFVRQSIDELLKKLPPEKRLEGLSPEERLEGLSPEELRAALEAVQRKLQANGPSAKPP